MHPRSLSHTHMRTSTHARSLTRTLTLSLTYKHTHCHALTLTHALSLARTDAVTHSLTRSLTHSLARSHTYTHANTATLLTSIPRMWFEQHTRLPASRSEGDSCRRCLSTCPSRRVFRSTEISRRSRMTSSSRSRACTWVGWIMLCLLSWGCLSLSLSLFFVLSFFS